MAFSVFVWMNEPAVSHRFFSAKALQFEKYGKQNILLVVNKGA